MPFSFVNFVNDIDMIDLMNESSIPRRRKLYKARFNPMEIRNKEFRNKYRFTKENMCKVIDIVRSDLIGDNRGGHGHIPVELQVMAAIRYWGRNEIQDDGADIHGFSQPTLCVICQRVAKAFASKSRQFIQMPTSISDQIKEMRGFQQIRNFPKVIGAIDCTHIKIPKVGGQAGQYYVNRKGYYSLNTQVVCDSSLKIRDIVCHWRGSTHDSRIFRESRIKERFESGEFKGILLGDGGYACTNILFTPLLNPRTQAECQYNIAQIATRNTVERCFGVWKQRFRILLTGMRCSLRNTKITVIALAVLHNLAIEFKDPIPDDSDRNEVRQEISNGDENTLHHANQNVSRSVFIQQYFNGQ